MSLSSLAVRRGVTFGMIFAIVFGFGLFSLGRLQLDLYPDITFPMVVVMTGYTGAGPEDIENLVTRPIEGAVSSAKNVEEITSTSRQGMSVVQVAFDWGTDMDQAETDVRRKLELVTGLLPEDADEPMVFAFDPSLQPILMYTVSGPYPLDQLRHITEEEIGPRLTRIEGIASAAAEGGLDRQIHVLLDPAKIAAYRLDVNAVVGAVYQENTQVPGGSLEQGSLDFTIQTDGKYRTVEEIGQVVVGMQNTATGPRPIRLGEVARIEDTYLESQRVLEVEGVPTVWLMVNKQSGANTVRACEAVKAALPGILEEVPEGIELGVIFDQSEFINLALGNLSSTALQGVGITFLVLLLFLRNLRSALIVSGAIPLSVVATFAVMDQANMTLNVLSMAGLALAIGMLVDNAIVVLENIFRLREEGLHPWDAAIEGTRTVSTAVVASTLTTVSVFVPVLFVPGIAGVMFEDMAVTICFSLTVSLLMALSFVPLSASRLLAGRNLAERLSAARTRDPLRRLTDLYGRALDWSLGHRKWVAASLGGLVVLTILLAALLPTGFLAENDQSVVFVQAEAPVGSNLGDAYRVMAEVQERIERAIPEAERTMITMDLGVGEGFSALFAIGVHAASFRVPLVTQGAREHSQAQLEDLVREALRDLPGVNARVAVPFNPLGGAGDIEVRLRGHDLDVSRRVGLELRDALRAMPEIAEVTFSMTDQKPQVQVTFDRPKMAELGLSTAAVGNAISTYFMGKTAGRYSDGGDEHDIVVRLAKEHRLDVEELRRMPVLTPAGLPVPLGNIADVREGLGPVDITRLDQDRVTRLTITLRDFWIDEDGGGHMKDLRAAIANVTQQLDAYDWPAGFSYGIGGTAEDFMESFGYLGIALLLSVVLVYMVMASQFESLRQPFIIIFTVPLAVVGVVLMFSVTRSTMDMSAMIGAIMLVGIVVNNGIILVDAANQLRESEGLDRRAAIARAARLRLRPVLMTSVTTIVAMIPLALEIGEGSESWSGMAKAVIGGLTVSTGLTLFVVPTMYTLFARKTLADKRAAIESTPQAAPVGAGEP